MPNTNEQKELFDETCRKFYIGFELNDAFEAAVHYKQLKRMSLQSRRLNNAFGSIHFDINTSEAQGQIDQLKQVIQIVEQGLV